MKKAKKTKRKKSRKKNIVNKPAVKTTRKRRTKKRTAKRAGMVAKKIIRKAVSVMAKRKKSFRGTRGTNRPNVKNMALDGAAIVGGVIGGAVLSNVIPVADGRIKAVASIAIGALLAGSGLTRTPIAKMAAMGMIAGGALALARRAMPQLTMLAGEEENLSLEYSGVIDDLEGIDEIEYSGVPDEIAADFEDIEGEGDGLEELTGVSELMGEERWKVAE